MTRKTYTLEHQRLAPGKGFISCEPHQAGRVAILEITLVPAKNGSRKYRITRTHSTFFGPAATTRARELLGRLVRQSDPGKPSRRKIWGRSLTTDEYNAVIAAKLEAPAVKWKRQPSRSGSPNPKGI